MALSGSLNFLSASITGSANIKVDFVGLNTLIVDPLTASSNDLGLPQSVASTAYYNSLVEAIGGPEPNQLNSLLLHRNGPYQHPIWNQYRGGDHPVARTLRLNNTMSIDQSDPDPIKRQNNKKLMSFYNEQNDSLPGDGVFEHVSIPAEAIPSMYPSLKQYYEPAVVSHHKPIVFDADVGGANAKVRMSLLNQMTFFSNQGLNNALKIASADPTTGSSAGFRRKNQNMYEMLYAAKALGGQNFIYSEQVFPRQLNLYRTFKLNKPNYEEVAGTGANGYDRESGTGRLFWKASQGGNTAAATSDGTTRFRTDGAALNSQGIEQDMSAVTQSLGGSLTLLSGTVPWNHTVHYISHGIVSNQINTITGGVDSDGNVNIGPTASFVQLEAYQPYPLSLLSAWPLDVRNDIYDSPAYLTSSIGGKGLQIGLTPHSSTSSYVSMSQADKLALNLGAAITRSAGELVYSTKPTIYFFQSGSADAPTGYSTVTASLQYNRHTFPYNTPFYATSRVRNREPMSNTYDDFKDGDNLKFAGRDFSIIPEFRMADHLQYYLSRYVAAKDFQIFSTAQKSDYTDGPKRRKIIRSAPVGPDNRTSHKLNFLRIDGADVTASSAQESFATSNPTTDLFTYDDGDILGEPTNTGLTTADHNYASDATAVKFLERYSHTEDLINFSHLMEQNGNAFTDDVNAIPSKIKFTCQGIKKLLPYNGFYPVLRTVQIGNAFKDAFNPYIQNINPNTPVEHSATDNKNAALQTLLEPFMAPGILYNSIKSGIAVDYPVYFRDKVSSNNIGQEPFYYLPEVYVSGATFGGGDRFTEDAIQGVFSSSFNYGGGYMMGVSRCMPTVLNSLYSRRLKFESLYNLKELDAYHGGYIIGVSDFVDLDRATTASAGSNGYTSDGYGGSQYHAGLAYIKEAPYVEFTKKPSEIKSAESMIYESSVNNFLCETMEFFLDDISGPGVKLPVVTSSPKKDDIPVDSQTTYYMEVTLRMGRTQVMCEGPRDAGIGRATFKSNSYSGSAMMRGYIYGPPMEVISHHSTTRVQTTTIGDAGATSTLIAQIGTTDYENYLGANLQDPAYHAYTPPYFYGDSNIIMAYTASSNALVENKVSYKVGVPDLFRGAQTDSFYLEQYVTNSINGDINGRLCSYMPQKGAISGLQAPTSGTFPRMKIESSIDVFNEPVKIISNQGVNEYNMLYIAPKWVCPVLDFSSSISAVENRTIDNNQLTSTSSYTTVTNTYHDHTTGRGMWGGYGTDPYDQNALAATGGDLVGKGIYLEIGDSFKNRRSDEEASNTGTNTTRTPSGFDEIDSFLGDRFVSAEQNRTDSLMRKLGFRQQALPIGRFAKQKTVSEAIVVIPYFDKKIDIKASSELAIDATSGGTTNTELASLFPGNELYSTREIIPGKHFLPIHKTLFENVLSVVLADQNLQPNDTETKNLVGMSSAASIQAAKDTDVGQMIVELLGGETKKGYQLPPEFDFIHNAAVDPFQMMVIPMSDTLHKQELIDIYQGVMPDASLNIKKLINSFSVRPNLLTNSLVAGYDWFPKGKNVPNLSTLGIGAMLAPTPALAQQLDETTVSKGSIPPWLKTSKDFYKNLKFMIFKVKERGEKDYESYRNDQIATALQTKLNSLTIGEGAIFDSSNQFANSLFDKKVKHVYGANWPYDYFSLIETVKIDVEVEVAE